MLEARHQALVALAAEDRGELGALPRQLAELAVQENVDDPPLTLGRLEQIVEPDRRLLGAQDAALHHHRLARPGPLAHDLEALPAIAVEAGGEVGNAHLREQPDDLLAL